MLADVRELKFSIDLKFGTFHNLTAPMAASMKKKSSPSIKNKEEIIRKAVRFPIDPVITRYMTEYGIDEADAHSHELELKRCLALSALNGKEYVVFPPLSQLWETFVKFTRLYSSFCVTALGGFIHYTPLDSVSLSNRDVAQTYHELLREYEIVFRAEPPRHIWPRETPGLAMTLSWLGNDLQGAPTSR
jgi:hypothetical protein